MRRWTQGTRAGLWAGVLALLLLGSAPGSADTRHEFWPELNAFVTLSERERLFLFAAFVGKRESGDGSDARGLEEMELGATLDITLRPLFRRQLRARDWERERYLWMRIGYSYSTDVGGAEDSFREHRGIVELTVRAPLASGFWSVHRGRIDLRDKDGTDSIRYRYRFTIEREMEALRRVIVPYVNAEFFYDTRFDTWNQERYQVGAEVVLSAQWRVEIAITHQEDRRADPERIDALGLALKYYR